MKVALYARVSTDDKGQDPVTQLIAMRDLCRREGWEIFAEYVDQAKARDLAHRTAWRALLADAARRRFKSVLVFKLDRAFRSVKHKHEALTVLEASGVAFRAVDQPFDTASPIGALMLTMLAAFAEFELEQIRERILAGMERARRAGKRIGRPSIADRRGDRFHKALARILPMARSGDISLTAAAGQLGVSRRQVSRYLQSSEEGPG